MYAPDLRAALATLSTAQRAFLGAAVSSDSDGDGLNDTLEGYWCTDPTKADSDLDGTNDGDEVAALKAWMNNERVGPPSTGKPFLNWPAQKANCPDDDQDSVPDFAETFELGLNPNLESTDHDKFDDGQELFGNTYCPGSGGFCGYGSLPRNDDWGVIFSQMPSWVKAPGNHPLIAAYPVPHIDVVESSLHVQTVTTINVGHTIASGTETSYSTAQTKGTSTSITDGITWSDWQEIAHTVPDTIAATKELNPNFNGVLASSVNGDLSGLRLAGDALGVAASVGAVGAATGLFCVATAGVGCAILAGAGLVGAGITLYTDLERSSGSVQDQAKVNQCLPNVSNTPCFQTYERTGLSP